MILSDLHNLQTVESSTSKLSASKLELQHDYSFQEESNDVPFNEDEEMSEVDSEDSDDEFDPETSVLTLPEFEDASVGDVKIGLKGSRLRYKVCDSVLGYVKHSVLCRRHIFMYSMFGACHSLNWQLLFYF